jgi:DNA-binding CsgD family transcriptional regulator
VKVFSEVLVDLYELAEHVSPHNFPIEALRLLRPLIFFEGAVIRIGETETAVEQDFGTTQEHSYKRDWASFACSPKASDYEQTIQAFLNDTSRPFVGTCQEFYKDEDLGLKSLYNYSQRHDFHYLLLCGDRTANDRSARWLVLYRNKTQDSFSNDEAGLLCALWRHITRAITINFRHVLNETNGVKSQRASALVNSQGLIEIADQEFSKLLLLEWPHIQVNAIPKRVIEELRRKSTYRGKRINISMYPKFGYMACTVSCLPLLESLSPCEQTVAEHFALGNSYKKIAQQLDMSPYTVRNHIANVYRKLGIHDKALLASLILHTEPTISAIKEKSEPLLRSNWLIVTILGYFALINELDMPVILTNLWS